MEKQEPQPLIFNEQNGALLKEAIYSLLRLAGKLVAMIIGFIPKLINYTILSFIFLNIYYSRGFEEALLLLLIGVIVAGRFNQRKNED